MDIPLGLAYISSYLKSKGLNDITLVDYNLLNYDYYNSSSYLKEIPLNGDVYGITITTPQFYWCHNIARSIKEKNKNALVIAGGPHASARPQECLEEIAPDFVVIGEGEETFHEIVTNPDRKITGTFSRSYRGDRRIINDLDSLPFPDRTLTDPTLYKRTIHGKRAFHVITSRDCPFNCSFCSKKAIGRNTRFRSACNFIAEIDFYIKEYGITAFVIYDDTFTVNKKRANKIAKELGKRNVIWRCFSRTDTINYETLNTFKKNGISSITFGVETFSQKMLNVYKKGTTVEDNKKALLLCKELGIPVRCSLIYGGPYETKDTLLETIQGVKETQPDEWNIATFVPVPGSDIGDNPDKYEIRIASDPFYLKHHRVGESGMGEILIDTSTMTPEEYRENRKWFTNEIESICPRRVIQDTIQTLRV